MIKSGCWLDCVYREARTDQTSPLNNTCSRGNEQVVGGEGTRRVGYGRNITAKDCSPEHSFVNKTLHLQHRLAVSVSRQTQ